MRSVVLKQILAVNCDPYVSHAAETLERDTFKSASEARDFGLIDEVIDKRPLDQPVAK